MHVGAETGPEMTTAASAPSQDEIVAIGRRIAADLPRAWAPGELLDARLLKVVGDDPELRAALFRFTDVRPACRGVRDLGAHLMALLDEAAPTSLPGRALLALARPRP